MCSVLLSKQYNDENPVIVHTSVLDTYAQAYCEPLVYVLTCCRVWLATASRKTTQSEAIVNTYHLQPCGGQRCVCAVEAS